MRVLGWGFTGLDRSNIWRAKRDFEVAGIDPASIEFSSHEKLAAGAGMVAGGAIIGGAAVAGMVIGTALADAISPPDKPGLVKSAKPGPVPAEDLEKAA